MPDRPPPPWKARYAVRADRACDLPPRGCRAIVRISAGPWTSCTTASAMGGSSACSTSSTIARGSACASKGRRASADTAQRSSGVTAIQVQVRIDEYLGLISPRDQPSRPPRHLPSPCVAPSASSSGWAGAAPSRATLTVVSAPALRPPRQSREVRRGRGR